MKRFVLILLAILAGMAAIGTARWRVASAATAVKERDDFFALPPTQSLRQLSFGYSSALADLIWSHILVTQGLRASEGRPFQFLEQYLDAVNVLDPTFREPYRLADSLLTFQQNDPDREGSARAARRILEKGLVNHPHDSRLWMDYGEFLAYVAPASLRDPEEMQRWKVDGARALVRAGELGSKDDNVYWHSISAVAILSKEGEREAMLKFLHRVYAVTEDEQLKRFIEVKLKVLDQVRSDERSVLFNTRFEEFWRETTPFAARSLRRALGPIVPSFSCAGPLGGARQDACARDWRAWARAQSIGEPALSWD